MRLEVVTPFLESTVAVLKTMAFTDAKSGKPYVKKGSKASGDVSGIIGITGDNEGSLSISFSATCICQVVSSMFGETITEVNEEVEDAVGEITNMISGDARRVLEAKGIVLKAAIPTVISGHGHTINHISKAPCVAIPFSTEGGEFTVELCLST